MFSYCLPTPSPPEVLFIVDHALDDRAHGDTVNQLVPQWWKLRVKVHLQIQTRRSGHNHILGLKSQHTETEMNRTVGAAGPTSTSRWQHKTTLNLCDATVHDCTFTLQKYWILSTSLFNDNILMHKKNLMR